MRTTSTGCSTAKCAASGSATPSSRGRSYAARSVVYGSTRPAGIRWTSGRAGRSGNGTSRTFPACGVSRRRGSQRRPPSQRRQRDQRRRRPQGSQFSRHRRLAQRRRRRRRQVNIHRLGRRYQRPSQVHPLAQRRREHPACRRNPLASHRGPLAGNRLDMPWGRPACPTLMRPACPPLARPLPTSPGRHLLCQCRAPR